MATVTVNDNAGEQRYEAYLGDELAGFAAYEDAPGLRIFTHTVVDDAFEGQGVGSALARGALDDVRAHQDAKVQPRCSFIAGFIDKHPDYADLVAEA